MNKLILTAAVCGAVGLASPAFAGSKRYDYRSDRGYERTDYAEVLDVDPITRQVRVSQPRQECWDERVTYREPEYRTGLNAGTVLGAIIGGVAGHQIGGGHGRDAATAVGAVIGAHVGAREAAYHRGGGTERVGYEQRCETYSDTRYEQRVEGYDVTYRYQGRIYHTQLPYDPGRRLEVDVNVRPVRY
jgi:uncharacterized protein YcfJ